MPCSSVTRLTASATFWLSLAAMALPFMMRAVIVPTYRVRNLQLLPGESDDRLPSRATDSPHLAADNQALTKALFDDYRPELHYMRGPGPKWHEKHDRAEIDGASPAVSRALMAGLRP